jgi:hypothetical protein
MKRPRPLIGCRLRHRFSRWADVKVDDMPGYEPDRRPELQFRMCQRCGHQEIREVSCV